MAPNNSVLAAFYSLGRKVNKLKGTESLENEEGIISSKLPELTLSTSNEDISKTVAKWQKEWLESDIYARWQKESKENENYWLGKHFSRPQVDTRRAMVDNAIFEALETYLPQVTRRNPDPMVTLKNKEDKENQEAQAWAKELQDKLGDIADEVVLRLKLKKQARHWALYLLGMIKVGWNLDTNMPSIKVIRASKLILDPDCTVDEDGYTGERIGEHRKMVASKLISILETAGERDAIDHIKKMVKDDLGTEIGFIEWWTQQATYWTLEDQVLLKKKNLHWNWDSKDKKDVPGEPLTNEETGEPMLHPETGEQMNGPSTTEETDVKGYNHFKVPGMPYIPLSVFNVGKHPIDDTSLIGQNLSNQDTINKRNKQIDKNADSMNGAIAVSLERAGLTKEQAGGITKAVQGGGTIAIPSGNVNEAIARLSAPGLPADIFNNLMDLRGRVKDLFGTRGSSAAGLESDTTVRGKIMNRTLDSDRIGGGFSEYLEQSADMVFNWCVQLLYVYDDKYANGQAKPEIGVSVKEGSLLPKDSTTIANQAIELAGQGKMAVIDMYKRLDYPNPEELTANVWLEVNAPETLFANDPRIQQVIQQKQQAQANANPEQKPPSTSISFKDLPPEGQAQLAKQAGIELHAEAIAAFNEHQKSQETPPPDNLPTKPETGS